MKLMIEELEPRRLAGNLADPPDNPALAAAAAVLAESTWPPTPPPSVIESVRSTDAAIGHWYITKDHQDLNQNLRGFYNLVNARSFNSLAPPEGGEDRHTIQGNAQTTPYLRADNTLGTYETRQTAIPGRRYEADAYARAETLRYVTPNFPEWTGAGSSWGLVVHDQAAGPGEWATAGINIFDPITFTNPEPGTFGVTFDPATSWDVAFSLGGRAAGDPVVVTITGQATSDIPGWASIFSYRLMLTPDGAQAQVVSNPRLGWDDPAIAQGIEAAFVRQGDWRTYTGGPLVAEGIPVPDCLPIGTQQIGHGCTSSATFATQQEDVATIGALS